MSAPVEEVLKNVEKFTLQPKQILGLKELLASGSVTRAAQSAGVTARTVYQWLAAPGFNSALRISQARLIRAAELRVGIMMNDALSVLESNMADIDAKVRLQAACGFLKHGVGLLAHVQMEKRLAALEKQLGIGTKKELPRE